MKLSTLATRALMALVVMALAAPPALAHRWGCWIQPNRTVQVRNTATNWSQANAALNEWDADTILSIPRVSSHTEVSVLDGNYGNTGWGGLASIESASGCNILHGHATLNTYYSYTSNGKRGVFCQEVGHLFGLDHSNDGGCMGGGYYYSINTNYQVVSHNISDINGMYANRLADTGGIDGLASSPEPAGPRNTAIWYHNPRSLSDLAGLSTAVVVARVAGIYEAADIVVPTEAFDEGEHRVPNQRIAFEVERTLAGDVGRGFELFHTGNDEFVLESDPPFAIGESYLLFVMPRDDGSYLVVSPEGRYQVTKDGLEPASHREFAEVLARGGLGFLEIDLRDLASR